MNANWKMFNAKYDNKEKNEIAITFKKHGMKTEETIYIKKDESFYIFTDGNERISFYNGILEFIADNGEVEEIYPDNYGEEEDE